MPVRLQKSPLALLGQFDLKIEGRNPDEFGSMITPTVDVAGQYGALLQTTSEISGLVENYSDNVFLPVPQNEAWRVLGAHAALGMAPATFPDPTIISVGFKPPGQLGVVLLGEATIAARTTAGLTALIAIWTGQPFWAPPGSSFETFLHCDLPNANAVSLRVWYERIVP